jgi:uncharacterized protein Smg (DUF494 family)
MFEVIQYILGTEQDTKLYYNQDNLVLTLINEQFALDEIVDALNWFYPIIDAKSHQSYNYQANAIRGFDYLENKYLSKMIINKILEQERKGIINSFIRDTLLDRMSVVAKDTTDEDELNELLDNLLLHVCQDQFVMLDATTKKQTFIWNKSFTIQ